jgi:hypothetical protein
VPAHLLILGERSGLAWVLKHEQMAFADHRRSELSRVAVGDDFLLYTTRGCFHNPTRDRGRVIGRAQVRSAIASLERLVTIGGREYSLVCAIRLDQLLPRGDGVVLSQVVSELSVFPNPSTWSAVVRRSLLTLPDQDAARLLGHLGQRGAPRSTALTAVRTYVPDN